MNIARLVTKAFIELIRADAELNLEGSSAVVKSDVEVVDVALQRAKKQ